MPKIKLQMSKQEIIKAHEDGKSFFISFRITEDRWELRVEGKPHKANPMSCSTKLICFHEDAEDVIRRGREVLPKDAVVTHYDWGFKEHYPFDIWTQDSIKAI